MTTTRKRTYFITGAAEGIGRAVAFRLLDDRQSIIVTDINKSKLVNSFGSIQDTIQILPMDVSDSQSVQAALKELYVSRIDVLINCAAIYPDVDLGISQLSLPNVIDTLNVNTVGIIRVTKALLPLLLNSDLPRVINLGSEMGSIQKNQKGLSYAYRMSKSSINMFTKCLSLELTQLIAVVIHPGHVRTNMGGDHAPLSATESADAIVNLIESLDHSKSGCFLDYLGSPIPW